MSANTELDTETNSESDFRNAKKGDTIVAGEKRHKILSTGIGKFGKRVLNIEYEGQIEELYINTEYQSLRRFIPGTAARWDVIPGTTNFTIEKK